MRSLLVFVIAVFSFFLSNGQLITTDSSYSPEDLVQNILLDGCVEATNITSSNGSNNGFSSIGYFDSSSSSFPFTNGVILSTGNISDAGNTAVSSNLNAGNSSWIGDTDLENVLNINNTLNATSLEFDFISAGNTISFNYILASEEYYNENPCYHSDYFAFLIKPSDNSAPYSNIALVPVTNSIVSTGTIHPQIIGFCDAENDNFFEGYNIGDTNYNGRTTVLNASTSITPNTSYHIKIIVADTDDHNLDTSVLIKGSSFNSNLNLGGTASTCEPSYTINSGLSEPGSFYNWYFNGNPLSQHTASLVATASGTYTLVAQVPYGNSFCSLQGTVEVTVNDLLDTTPISNYEKCEGVNYDNTELFQLFSKNTEAINATNDNGTNYEVTYYPTEADALAGTNALPNNYNNIANPQTVYVIVKNVLTGCKSLNNFDLVVNSQTPPPTMDPAEICDYDSDGFGTFNLVPIKNFYLGYYPSSTIRLFATPENAQENYAPLPNYYNNTSNPQTLYLRISTPGQCPRYTTITLKANIGPEINSGNFSLNACQENQQFASFNLNNIIPEILVNPTNPNYSFSFHLTINNAINGVNAITNPANYTNTTPFQQTLYLRIKDNANPDLCPTIGTFTIFTNAIFSNLPGTTYYICDDTDNDGIAEFDLTNVATFLSSGYNYNVSFYHNQTDLQNNTNAIDKTQPFINNSNPETVYVHIQDNNGCFYNTPVSLNVAPYFDIESPSATFDYCSTTNSTSFNIDFSAFTEELIGTNDYSIAYYVTEADALNGTNEVLSAVNTTNPQTFYAEVIDNTTLCNDIINFTINVLPAPAADYIDDIYICDDDDDGLYTVDLTTKIPELVDDTTDRTFKFFLNSNDAVDEINEITTPTAYTTETDNIIVKIINDNTGCYTLRVFGIFISFFDENAVLNNQYLCENDGNGEEPIIFSDYDVEILAGDINKEVLYFENYTDAENNINAINKSIPYINTSNPQQIYVRIQSTFDSFCYKTYSFTVEVKEEPNFIMPDDQNLCDDISNDGIEAFDLSIPYNTILSSSNQSLNVSFHTSQTDAEFVTNSLPLNYTNISNPQTLYVRVAGSNECIIIFPMDLNVISVADFQQPDTYEVCDSNFDGIITLDITSDDTGALPERLDNLAISYYHSINDAEQDVNSINNPENYTVNQSAVLYIKIRNVVSDCYLIYPFSIVVHIPPVIQDSNLIEICDTDDDSINLNDYNNLLINDTTDVSVSYYPTLASAEQETDAIDPIYTYTNTNFTLYLSATVNTTGCNTIRPVEYIIHPVPVANAVDDIYICTNETTFTYNLNTLDTYSFGTQNNTELELTYHLSLQEAESNENAISNTANYDLTNNLELFTRVTNTITGCYDISSFTAYLIPFPIIPLEDTYILCPETNPLVLSANTGNMDDSYLWTTGNTTSDLLINTPGIYGVTVTSINGCTSTKYINVIASEQATITSIETTNFSNNNSITLNISGIGDYWFSLDGGTPQPSPVFEDVIMGHHTITITDDNGCSDTISDDIVIFGFPNYFTPNNDGINDYWNVFGFNTFTNSVIYIFDRYGKLMKTIAPGDIGWDGTYNGVDMPSTDYWFKAIIKDVEVPFEKTGHFSLKR